MTHFPPRARRARITPDRFGYWIVISNGPLSSEPFWALTRRGAEHKAQRLLARLAREDERQAQTWEIGAGGNGRTTASREAGP